MLFRFEDIQNNIQIQTPLLIPKNGGIVWSIKKIKQKQKLYLKDIKLTKKCFWKKKNVDSKNILS